MTNLPSVSKTLSRKIYWITVSWTITLQEINAILSEVTQTSIPLCPLNKGGSDITLEKLDMLISAHDSLQVREGGAAVTSDMLQDDVTVTMHVISAVHFDETPEGMVEAIILAQAKSGIPRNDFYIRLRQRLLEAVPVVLGDDDA